ncbi:hypothetical protein D3C86_1846010 [compost metagenome]
MLNHIGFEIKPDNIQLPLLANGQVVIQRKGQIGFAAAKIHNGQRTSGWQIGQHILHHLQKTVDLAELIVFLGQHFSLAVHNPQLHQKWHRLPFVQHIPLAAVMGQIRCLLLARRFGQD